MCARTHRGSSGTARGPQAQVQTPCSLTLPRVRSLPRVEGTPRRGWPAGPGETPVVPRDRRHSLAWALISEARPPETLPAPVGQDCTPILGSRPAPTGVCWAPSLGTWLGRVRKSHTCSPPAFWPTRGVRTPAPASEPSALT